MDLNTLGIAMGSAWLSGINLYATVLTLGLLQRWNIAHLPGDLSALSHKKRLLPFHLSLPCGSAVVSGLGRASRPYYRGVLP